MSNVIKSDRYVSLEQKWTVEPYKYGPPAEVEVSEHPAAPAVDEGFERLQQEKERLLQDAKEAAEEQIRLAEEEVKRRLEEANAEIERWWNERRVEDLQVVEESREAGYETGYQEGLRQAEAEMAASYQTLLEQGRQLVEEATLSKERIISEAEPFLVELSIAIARKIIGEQLAVSPEWTASQVKRTLERRREKGIVTICVSPAEFMKMQEARNELLLSIDSQAELQIVPDSMVDMGGCVVRTAYGSVDARIDTQLTEIKTALLEIAVRQQEGAAV